MSAKMPNKTIQREPMKPEFAELINRPQLRTVNKEVKNKSKIVTPASIAGSAIGIASAVGCIYKAAKTKNPAASLKNLSYEEADVLLIGAGSVLGGLAGGLIADKDKKNVIPKLREASQQFIGNMVFPISILACANKLLNKYVFKSNQTPASAKGILLKSAVCVASLVGGMELGNKVMNKVNNKVFKEDIKHDVKAEDYLVHADDLCLTANMVLKDFKSVSAITSKLLPFTFIVAGSKTGMANKE